MHNLKKQTLRALLLMALAACVAGCVAGCGGGDDCEAGSGTFKPLPEGCTEGKAK